MTQSTKPISPLRQRMIEDMAMRKLAPKTQASYICAVKKLADYMGHSPHTATAEDLRKFQLHLTEIGTSRITINTTITALRFFFDVTVGDKDVVGKLKTVPVPRKLPVVLSREEVARLLQATSSLKYKAAFSIAYGAGLRINEVTTLKISDIDGERKTLHVEQGTKSRRFRRGAQRPLRLALTRVAGCSTPLVEGRPRQRPVAEWWLVVSRTEPGQSDQQPPVISRHYCRRSRCRDRQASNHAPAQAFVRNSFAGTEGRYPPDPGIARP
jgi:integrase